MTDQTHPNSKVSPPKSADGKTNQILTWILEGQSEFAIREAIQQTWPDDNQQSLIESVFLGINETAICRTHESVENWCFEATRFLYQKLVEIGDYTGAMRAIRQLRDFSAETTQPKPTTKTVEHHHMHAIAIGPNTNDTLEVQRVRLAQRIAAIGDDE